MKNNKKGMLSALPLPAEGRTGWPFDEETDQDLYTDSKTYPAISIVTPSFNQGEFIEQTIRSVLLQNYPNLEYIVIDGGSTDGTVDILKRYSPWIKFWVSENDKGQSNAINKGAAKCEGEIFGWINSDDFYEKNALKKAAEIFADGSSDILIGSCRFKDEVKKHEKILDFRLRRTLEETLALVLINQPAVFYKLDIFRKTGELNENLNCVMDQDFWKRYLFRNGMEKVKVINDVLTNFRYHSSSKTYRLEFRSEYGDIFRSIAGKAGMSSITDVIDKIFGSSRNCYEFGIEFDEKDKRLAAKVINNLIYYYARTFFTKRNFKMFDACYTALQSEYLNERQNKYMRNLKVKSMMIKLKLEPVVDFISSMKDSDKSDST